MFRSDEQLARACRALCAQVGLAGLWTIQGPTERAIELLSVGGGPLSSGERMVFLAAWGVWNGSGDAMVGDVVHRLDGRALSALGSLMVAVADGSSAIDEWLAAMATACSERESARKAIVAATSQTASASDGGHERASGDVMTEPAD